MAIVAQDFVNLDFDFTNESPVECLLCEKKFEVTKDPQPMLEHLLSDHKFLISSQEEVVDFRQYICYWQKLKHAPLEDYCSIITTNTEPRANGKKENFYLLCDKLLEDKQLRTTLRETKLRYLARQKELEYGDKNFSRSCMCCQEIVTGGVANSFHHLTFKHGFSLGNPDNIVFGATLLNIMEEKLQKLLCLHCDSVFTNHGSLREHMRKKQHRSLNPKDKSYDKFYFLNYLKPGTPWQAAKKAILEEQELPTKDFDAEETSDDENQWTDWREDSELSAICLFCPFTTSNIPSGILHHMLDNHSFDFLTITKDFSFYSRVKLLNYIRSQQKQLSCITCDASFQSSEELAYHLTAENHIYLPDFRLWDQSRYMTPVIDNDGILFYLDDNDIEDDDTSSTASFVDDEVVYPEDAPLFPTTSVLGDWRIREEIGEEMTDESNSNYRCFFCSFSKVGKEAKVMCINHMNSMHNFDFKSLKKLDQPARQNCVNYLRLMTERNQCFCCHKTYITRNALEEHRLLEGHTEIPEILPLYDITSNKRDMKKDGFITD